jgi:tRNA dimethylallyltransferase
VIVNADSAQLYADLPILSAAPTEAETSAVPHLLYGEWDGATACSAADWAARAREVIAAAHTKGVVPILVGGTGLYIRTLLDGIAPVPEIDADIRQAVRALPVAEAYAALTREDPARAAALAPADSARISRALEVVRSTGRPLAAWQEERVGGIGAQVRLHPLVLLPDRAALYARCDRRFARMIETGAIEEVRALIARNLDPALPVMRAIGVAEIAGYLRGDWPLAEAEARGAQATRNYAKRQYTWLRHQPPPDWPRHDPSPGWASSGSNDYEIPKLFETLFLH